MNDEKRRGIINAVAKVFAIIVIEIPVAIGKALFSAVIGSFEEKEKRGKKHG